MNYYFVYLHDEAKHVQFLLKCVAMLALPVITPNDEAASTTQYQELGREMCLKTIGSLSTSCLYCQEQLIAPSRRQLEQL